MRRTLSGLSGPGFMIALVRRRGGLINTRSCSMGLPIRNLSTAFVLHSPSTNASAGWTGTVGSFTRFATGMTSLGRRLGRRQYGPRLRPSVAS